LNAFRTPVRYFFDGTYQAEKDFDMVDSEDTDSEFRLHRYATPVRLNAPPISLLFSLRRRHIPAPVFLSFLFVVLLLLLLRGRVIPVVSSCKCRSQTSEVPELAAGIGTRASAIGSRTCTGLGPCRKRFNRHFIKMVDS